MSSLDPQHTFAPSSPTPRRRYGRRPLAVLGALGLVATMAGAQEMPTAAPSVDIESLEAGARGYGLSVFSGTEPERFDVEVIGVMKNQSPNTSFLLARLSGKGLETSGVVGGMSGSPVYFGEQLAGAVAFSWPFMNEAIAGITPIGAMRDVGLGSGAAKRSPGTPVSFSELLAGRSNGDAATAPRDLADTPERLLQQLRALAPTTRSGAAPSLQWVTVGVGDTTRQFLAQAFGNVAPAGGSTSVAGKLEGGGAVAGILVGGDLQMAFTGTVTERRGDEILAFGHSFLGIGPMEVPMAPAEVVTVISSQANSFKITNVGEPVGAFDLDRYVGIRGHIGARARTIPLHIDVVAADTQSFDMQVARIPQMAPSLMAVSLLSALEASQYTAGNQSLQLRSTLQLRDHGELALDQTFEGGSAAFSGAVSVINLLAYLLNHPDEEVEIESVALQARHADTPQTATLRSAHAERTVVAPGDEVTVHLDLSRYRGDTYRVSLPVRVPKDAAAGTYYVFVGDGPSIDALEQQIAPQEPATLESALDILRSLHRQNDLVVLGAQAGRGLLVEGTSLPDLPASIRSLWAAGPQLKPKALTLAVRDVQVTELAQPLVGATRIDLQIKPRGD